MKALYRKYRPKTLEEVVGQDQVTGPLSKSLAAGKINHAYLFIGPRGTGKTSVARIFAHQVNGFKYELEDDYVDIVEIDGASNRGIDNIRELREKAAIAPSSGKYKIYIIDEVHMLTKEAFNALLKTLEEPPAHVIFIMATTDAYKVPVTITSRAQTYTFKLADHATMCDFLQTVAKNEKIKIEDEALAIVAKRGGGSFRDSLSLLDQISTLSKDKITKELVVSALGLPENEKISSLMQAYLNGNLDEIANIMKDLLSAGIKPEVLAEELINNIIESPEPAFFPLLEKLPEVKEPFASARLLVALMPMANAVRTTTVFQASQVQITSSPAAIQSSPRPTKTVPTKTVPQKTVPTKTVPQKAVSPEAETPSVAPARPAKAPEPQAHGGAFDWSVFLDKINTLNETVYTQLTKCEYETRGGTLHLYPRTKIIRNILAKANNKKILVDSANNLQVEIHAAGEHPDSFKKDETLSKISDIMGGEVINDNGGFNPF